MSTEPSIPINRFIKVRIGKRVYDKNTKEYWLKREYMNAKNSIYGSNTLKALFGRQKGECEYCKQPITETDVKESAIHKHHMKPRSEGGNWKLSNLRLLHADCHTSLYNDKGIDYLRLMKPAKR